MAPVHNTVLPTGHQLEDDDLVQIEHPVALATVDPPPTRYSSEMFLRVTMHGWLLATVLVVCVIDYEPTYVRITSACGSEWIATTRALAGGLAHMFAVVLASEVSQFRNLFVEVFHDGMETVQWQLFSSD
jgi:hypothetical protein